MFFNQIQSKIITSTNLRETLGKWRKQGDTIVFTNGCFDILHYGHVHYLSHARNLGNRLIIGLNSDASVKRLKGPHRPIQDEISRAHVLAALLCVDAVTIFTEDTPYQLIEIIKPDILVKGGDWRLEEIVGTDIVLANGGKVHSLPYVEGHSTSKIEGKIRRNSDQKL